MNVLIAIPFKDQQTGTYLFNTLIQLKNRVAYFDWRDVTEQLGIRGMNDAFIETSTRLKPDVIIVCKGLGILPETIRELKKICPVVGWIFDVTLGGTYVKDSMQYLELIKEFTAFYTIDAGAIDELKHLGVNAKWLPEGCYPELHREQVINSFQKKMYGSDVTFIGSVGSIHKERDELLKRISDEGINLKIWGEIYFPEGEEPDWVKQHHSGYGAINDMHSVVCQSSKVNIGIDGWPHRKYSWSARMYRVMCSGGFYLTSHTEGIEEFFIPGVHLDTYKTPEEMIEKILYYLTHDEERERIAKAGQELVLKEWTFEKPLKQILEEHCANN